MGKRRLSYQLDKVAIKAVRKKRLDAPGVDVSSVARSIKREVDIMLQIQHVGLWLYYPDILSLEYELRLSESSFRFFKLVR